MTTTEQYSTYLTELTYKAQSIDLEAQAVLWSKYKKNGGHKANVPESVNELPSGVHPHYCLLEVCREDNKQQHADNPKSRAQWNRLQTGKTVLYTPIDFNGILPY